MEEPRQRLNGVIGNEVTFKKELVHREKYASVEEAKASLFEYIEVFYNRQRRHSALDYRSPEEFEANEYS